MSEVCSCFCERSLTASCIWLLSEGFSKNTFKENPGGVGGMFIALAVDTALPFRQRVRHTLATDLDRL